MRMKAWLRFILAVTSILLFPEALLREEQNLRERQRAAELSTYDCRTLEQVATGKPVRLCIADDMFIRRRPLRLRPEEEVLNLAPW